MSLYKIPKRIKGKDRTQIHNIIKSGIGQNLTTTQIYNAIKKDKNTSYRYQDVLHDIRLKKASYNIGKNKEGKIIYSSPSSRQAQINKQIWFKEVFEKFRLDNNLTPNQARKLIKQEMVTSHKNYSEKQLGKKFYDIYKEVFS